MTFYDYFMIYEYFTIFLRFFYDYFMIYEYVTIFLRLFYDFFYDLWLFHEYFMIFKDFAMILNPSLKNCSRTYESQIIKQNHLKKNNKLGSRDLACSPTHKHMHDHTGLRTLQHNMLKCAEPSFISYSSRSVSRTKPQIEITVKAIITSDLAIKKTVCSRSSAILIIIGIHVIHMWPECLLGRRH